ncbi:MAG: hypothetical protein KAU01_05025 [Candidatus Cloacimonetes bacterium]|nr:hypothetical protein [Candidatus Cloacimonadota bacterium]
MIDIHTHLLHGCDDGSPDIETSLSHLKKMIAAGVSIIVVSPHFIRNTYHNTSEGIEKKFKELKSAIKKEKIPVTLFKAAEVYLDMNSKDIIKSENFTINDTDYVIVETNLTGFPTNLYEILYELVTNGYKPILAHPERYTNIIRNPELSEDIIHRNVYFQLNAGSLLGQYGKSIQKTAWFLLEKGFVHFLASDTHCKSYEYTLPIAVEEIKKNVDKYTAELLTEINPTKMLNNEKIEFFYLDSEVIEKKNFFSRIFK